MNLEQIQEIVRDDFLKAYFYRYFEFEKTITYENGRTHYSITDILIKDKTDQHFIEAFGSYDALFQDIRLFSKTVKEEHLDTVSIEILELGKKYIEAFPTFHEETDPNLFLINDKASKTISSLPPKKVTYEYDIRSAWSSCLTGNVPISSVLLDLTPKEKSEILKSCLKPRTNTSKYLFGVSADIEKSTDNTIHTERQYFYLWGFEVAHFLKTNLFSSFTVLDVFQITYSTLPGVDLFLNKLYNRKQNSNGLIEYNFWKSHMNNFNRLVFHKSALVYSFVLSKIRMRVYEAISNQKGIISLNLDSITSTKKLTHLKFSDRMGGWREVDKHKRNFSSADRIAQYDLRKGIFK